MENFDKIRKDGRLLYEFICGSTLYGLNTKDSDVDTKGVFLCTTDELFGLDFKYNGQVNDARSDNVWYELKKFLSLLCVANPTILETLFIPKDKVIGEIHPIMQEILSYKDEFVTKRCFDSFMGYASAQIHKARGLNKKIVNPIKERLGILDFVYTFKDQGSTKIMNWLNHNGLKQMYCGLVNVPNMHGVYAVYYDFARHIDDGVDEDKEREFINFYGWYSTNPVNTIDDVRCFTEVKHYRGILNEDETSTDLRLSSISKGEKPICYISFNKDGYICHCTDYRNYKMWEKERNPKRYESNLNKNYDSKNMMHCIRLLHMGIEIANGEGVNPIRTWDKEFLMDVRNHKFEYDYILEYLERKKEEFKEAEKTSTIKEKVNTELVNHLLVNARNKQLKLF